MEAPAEVAAPETEKEDGADISAVLGPPYSRDLELWKQLCYALLFGVILSFIGLAFLNIIEETPKQWMGSSYDSYTAVGFMDGKWWWLGVTTGCATVVGCLRAAFMMEDPPGFVHEIKTQQADYRRAPLVILTSAISLAGGASLGPEAGMGAVGGAVGAFISDSTILLGPEAGVGAVGGAMGAFISDRVRMPAAERRFNVLAGIAAAFGALMPAAYLGVTIVLELLNWAIDPQDRLSNLVVRMTLSSTAAYWIFTALEDRTFLELSALPAAAYDDYDYQNCTAAYWIFTALEDRTFLELSALPAAAYDDYDYQNWYLAAAVPLGVAAAALTFSTVVLIAIFKRVGALYLAAAVPLGVVAAALTFATVVLIAIFKRAGAAARARGRGATIIYAASTGLIYGIIGVCLPLTLTSGSAQLSVVTQHAAALGKGVLAATLCAKAATLALCLSSGMVGGFVFPLIFMALMRLFVFPLIFIGTTAGALTHLLIPGLPLLLTTSTMMAAVPCALVPAPLSLALLVAQGMVLGARDTQPVIVAVWSAHMTLAGSGVIGALLRRRRARAAVMAAAAAARSSGGGGSSAQHGPATAAAAAAARSSGAAAGGSGGNSAQHGPASVADGPDATALPEQFAAVNAA
ncbi:hypothetical protein JKP88DRAFT_323381 [Tribonema minus]|uniref:Chloride channel protein n=1 Tax=Tribonema minus TaxID=303371 RepID=A0A835Z1S9_9STRA|nr:hypothetical protein JKP88DRAFT_323381 [Tribonema minus]